tara:strand:+ start:714 stop:845 length:132 start_codon:yes stop_codon:yes gene_type:complete
LIDNLYGIISLVSFMGIMVIAAYVAIPKDIMDIKQILRDIRHG